MKLRKNTRAAFISFIAVMGIAYATRPAGAQTDAPLDHLHIPVADDPTARALAQKVQSIIIDKIDFDHLGIADVLKVLTAKSKELDPAKTGINFTYLDPAPDKHLPYVVTLQLENVPLDAVLDLIGQQTMLRFSINAYAVSCQP